MAAHADNAHVHGKTDTFELEFEFGTAVNGNVNSIMDAFPTVVLVLKAVVVNAPNPPSEYHGDGKPDHM